jgi:catalase
MVRAAVTPHLQDDDWGQAGHDGARGAGDRIEAGIRAEQGQPDPKADEQANAARSSMQAKA